MPRMVEKWHKPDVAAMTLREQERLGRQLHDTIGPQMTAIGMLANSLHERLRVAAAAETNLAEKLLHYIELAKADLRALAKGLIPVEVDEEGLMGALAELADETEDSLGIRCRFECDSAVRVTDNFVATRLFRIAREAVHNSVKHGKSKEVVIRLSESDHLELRIEDDGIGISRLEGDEEGNGIRIMQYRAGLIGGELDIQRIEGGGTRVACTINRQLNCDL
jgi:signal transduction histidine kinase